ncbi:hypothetical protein [Streptomyces brasiliscabiei]|uniref:hypothetical protein n=1 Tax=Streptomyces brasiliscabiei TaxID=2736302 RepID=UPI001C126E90|nr:hypothetical protein [Streptomyces brasiliscabiei]
MKIETLSDSQLIDEIVQALLAAPFSSSWQEKVDRLYSYCSENNKLEVYQEAYEEAARQADARNP